MNSRLCDIGRGSWIAGMAAAWVSMLLLAGGACAAERGWELKRNTPQSLLFGINMVANPHVLHRPEGYQEDVYRTLQRIGGTMVRLAASPREIEAVRGTRDWSEFEAGVDLALRYGMEPMILIVNTPLWALPKDETLPEGMDPTYQYPYRTELFPEFADLCRDLARRMKGKATLFQLWNEPNGCSWHFHDGFNHADEYMPFLKVAYEAIKGEYPEAVVLLGSLDDGGGNGHIFLNMAYEIRDREYAGRRLFDGVTVHPYDRDIANKERKLRRLYDIMVKNGDADLPLFITEYGWRTGAEGDGQKSAWLRETLAMYQKPDMRFLAGAIHLSLSDFEGEPGFGLTDENLRPRGSFSVFQGTPRFGAAPPHTIDWRPVSTGEVEVTWKTELPARSTLRGVPAGREGAGGEVRVETAAGQTHRARLANLAPGTRYRFEVATETLEGATCGSAPYFLRAPGPQVPNGDFDEGFFAGIAEGWRIVGNGLCTDAAVFPGSKDKVSGHAQVVFAVPERNIGLDSTAVAWVAAASGTAYRASAVARKVSVESGATLRARIGVDSGGTAPDTFDRVRWSDWSALDDEEVPLAVEVAGAGPLMTVCLQVQARDVGQSGRPAALFDRVTLATGDR